MYVYIYAYTYYEYSRPHRRRAVDCVTRKEEERGEKEKENSRYQPTPKLEGSR